MLVNGKHTEIFLPIDRGIEFGDGCFTTAAIFNGKIILFSEHIKRLKISCAKLNINFVKWDELKTEMHQLASIYQRAALKVIITRGLSRSGYSVKESLEPTRIVRITSWPRYYDFWRKKGIILYKSPIRLGRNPYLAGLKHLNRLEQVMISIHIQRQSLADEALVFDSEGLIIECCTANILWRKNDTIFTPRLDQAGVNGIMRQFCLSILNKSKFNVIEVHAREKALTKADEIIICNTLMPIIPVLAYNNIKYYSRKLFKFLSPFCKELNLI